MFEVTTKCKNYTDLFNLYEELEWDKINLSIEELKRMTEGSWYSLFYYDDNRLIGTGRIISDGVITGLICGVGVSPKYQKQGMGKKIIKQLVTHCENKGVFPQLLCENKLVDFYKSLRFRELTVGMIYEFERG